MTFGYTVHCRGCAREIAVNAAPGAVLACIVAHEARYHGPESEGMSDAALRGPDPWVDVMTERERQDRIWGPAVDQVQTADRRLAILAEEFGEYAHEVTERCPHRAREELVQLAAVAIANIDRIDAGRDRR